MLSTTGLFGRALRPGQWGTHGDTAVQSVDITVTGEENAQIQIHRSKNILRQQH